MSAHRHIILPWPMMRRLLFLSVSFCLLILFSPPLWANTAQIDKIQTIIRSNKLYLDADITLDITGELRTAAMKGMPIFFIAETRIIQTRWWWFDNVIAKEEMTWRISYNALTRQWRVRAGDLSFPEASFDDALDRIRFLRGWAVASLDAFDVDSTYEGRLRLRLDTSRLARPFRVDAFNSSAWLLATPWKNFTFSISASLAHD